MHFDRMHKHIDGKLENTMILYKCSVYTGLYQNGKFDHSTANIGFNYGKSTSKSALISSFTMSKVL